MKYEKQVKLADELVDELRKRVSNYVITTGFDTNGWPTILLAILGHMGALVVYGLPAPFLRRVPVRAVEVA